MPNLLSLKKSKRDKKRFVIKFDNPRQTIHFGYKGGSTYIDHKDKLKRKNYIARHRVNENWEEINAGSLSRYLLWGEHTNLKDNLEDYLKRFNITYL